MIKKLNQQELATFHRAMVDINPKQFQSHVDSRPFAIQHQLQQHPLFQLQSLIELAKRLLGDQREYVFDGIVFIA